MRLPVMAENLHMFKRYISEHKVNQGHFDYVTGEGSIRGRRGIILTVGKWWRNPNYKNQGFADSLSNLVAVGCISLVDASWESEDMIDLLKTK